MSAFREAVDYRRQFPIIRPPNMDPDRFCVTHHGTELELGPHKSKVCPLCQRERMQEKVRA